MSKKRDICQGIVRKIHLTDSPDIQVDVQESKKILGGFRKEVGSEVFHGGRVIGIENDL